MTERVGGFDFGMSETPGTYSARSHNDGALTAVGGALVGQWLINDFEWFSSATDANMANFTREDARRMPIYFQCTYEADSPTK